MARLLKANGEILPNVSIDTLKKMQDLVDGYIEFVYLSPSKGLVLIVNEEGLIKELPVNVQASIIAGQPLFGDIVEVPADEFQSLDS